MKKSIIALLAVLTAGSVFAQGTIVYYNRITGSVVAPIYGPELDNPALALTGNTTAGTPAGVTVYTGAPLAGTGFTAELWAGATADSLVAVPGTQKDFRTGGFAGAINSSGLVVTIPGFAEAATPFLQVRAWDNEGGTILNWDDAQIKGASLPFVSAPLGGLAPPPNMVGLTSFNLHVIPEPSTFALLGLGALGMFLFRRK